ncbi:PAS domain S-box protein [Myxococcus llanfairpwllgwyngyllgogerychwyrndrobwllllantysiliogogogochensis]|uniref:histidine kinase n=1 Tax=Myxococcus llanfairpwllgwyngyllgogerychwyrndrobwllllantysiliogogogochensis TaxID=2590453 RepID=A0A540X9I2_9BACT|nr:PAS domain S-box protein [Myxococcus llanfairpwllgwyngyllgogerychwyrndrobwllllantysiliogogogochensis]TQF17953.1 PAS domain S-box protein [Myxococcus llanfairpwllgwyngyllgogerychwyrndrobwllllantysiliogogogochensis]
MPIPLADFLIQNRDTILEAWEVEVRSIPAAQALTRPALRDGLPGLLEGIARMMRKPQAELASGLSAISDHHALERLGEGFDLRQVVTEYRLLRGCVLRLWSARGHATLRPDEERIFHEAMDEAVAAAVSRYTRARERTIQALDRISAAALGSPDVAGFLPRLLQVLCETVAAVDVAVVLLRDGEDFLRVESGVGEGVDIGGLVPMGQGFAGTIAATREPLLVHDASRDERAHSAVVRTSDVRALYGVPLVLNDVLIGVALMGSRVSTELSEEDLLLFRAMASRATGLLAQGQARDREREARAEAEASLKRLRESEAGLRRWEEVFFRLGVGVVVVSAEDDTLLDVNPAFARMHGASPEELIGQPLEATIAPEARGMLPRHAAAANSKPSHEYESLHVRKDGSRFPAFSHVTAFRDETGKVSRRVATVLDITQRRAVETDRQRLLSTIESERARLAAVLEQLPAGVFIADAASGRLVLANRQVAVLTGRPFQPMSNVDTFATLYGACHPDGTPYAPDAWPLARTLSTGEVVQGEEAMLKHEDGHTLTVLVSSAPIRDRDGELIAGVATLADVTERRRAQEAELQAARFGERLIAIVSHDLRNPLNAIHLSTTQLLHSEVLAERERRFVTRIARSSARMTRMISELLDFTRGRLGGGIPIQRTPGDLRAVVRQGVEELEAAWPERTLRVAGGTGRYDGQWDADRLLQVVSNLGGNALQYSAPDAPVTLTLSDLGDTVVLEVHNPGEPISAEALPHLFDPFRRATSSHPGSSISGGLGLGLYIVEQVVKGHGGHIQVTSTEADGTVFKVTLPRVPPPA